MAMIDRPSYKLGDVHGLLCPSSSIGPDHAALAGTLSLGEAIDGILRQADVLEFEAGMGGDDSDWEGIGDDAR